MTGFALYLFGWPVLTVTWGCGPPDEPGELVYSGIDHADHDDGISYSCGHCGEVLVAGLRRALTPRDEADLLTTHDCDTPDEGGRAATLR